MVSSLFHIWDHSDAHTDTHTQTDGHKTDNAGQRPRDSGGYPPYGKPENPPDKSYAGLRGVLSVSTRGVEPCGVWCPPSVVK